MREFNLNQWTKNFVIKDQDCAYRFYFDPANSVNFVTYVFRRQ